MPRLHTAIAHFLGFWLVLLLIATVAALPGLASSQGELPDNSVTRAVEEVLYRDTAVPLDELDVQTLRGIVQMSGTVTNLRAKQRAEALAETVRGVRGVVNRIVVDPAVPMPARDLARDVDDALFADPATESFEIDVAADEDGVVTLSGAVESWAERQLAETIASGVYGVTDVVNEIEIEVVRERDDARIRDEIEARLRWDTLVDGALIDVTVTDGRVVLDGTVGSAAERSRARTDAWVAGVREVDSEGLDIERWARDPELRANKYLDLADDEIAAAVNAALSYDPRVAGFEVTPEVENGVVALYGIVDNVKAKQAAARDARNVVGVRRVKNRIKVRPIPRLGDEAVAENVEQALARDVFVGEASIEVQVANRVVTLTGLVDSTLEKAQAEDVAFRSKGVQEVRNQLTVATPEVIFYDPYVFDWTIYDYDWYDPGAPVMTKSDRAIHEDLGRELYWSPFVDREDVSYSVEDGVVTLTGTVQSHRERAAAEENAYEAGARRVRNDLEVGGGA
jgi:osmotically-inducible protein OsmY